MKIGDRVILRSIPENNMWHLKPHVGKIGTIVNVDHAKPPKFLRVSFGRFYEDVLTWRVMLA